MNIDLITRAEWDRFYALRAALFAEIAAELAIDGHCKSYEGTFSITWPNYFHEKAEDCGWYGDQWGLKLDCYLVGPGRHHYWSGRTFQDALQNAERDIRAWITAGVEARAKNAEEEAGYTVLGEDS